MRFIFPEFSEKFIRSELVKPGKYQRVVGCEYSELPEFYDALNKIIAEIEAHHAGSLDMLRRAEGIGIDA